MPFVPQDVTRRISGPRARIAAAAALVVLAALLAWGAWAATWNSPEEFVRDVDIGTRLFADYSMRFHPVARDFLEMRRPYPGYYYSPAFAVLLAPLGKLPLADALRLWGVGQVVFSVALLLVPSVWMVRRSLLLFGAYSLVFLTSMPVLHSFNWGQVSVLMTALSFGCLFLYRGGRTIAAAVLLAAAVTIKFYPGIYLLYFVVRRDWKFLAAFGAAWAVFGLVVPALVLGPGDTLTFYRDSAANMSADRAKITVDANSQYLPHVVERWTYRLRGEARPLPEHGSPARTALRAVAAALFLFHVVLLIRRHRTDPDPIPAFALLSVSIPLLIPTAWPHYFVFLPFLLAWAAWRVRHARRTWAIWGALLLASAFASSLAGYRAAGDWWTYSHAGFPMLATLGLIIVLWGPATKRPR